ncbi:hypothetical protein A2U01_0094712, partial [Trifolium medium]|nr:hypothetical protein [Trifolium medium]
ERSKGRERRVVWPATRRRASPRLREGEEKTRATDVVVETNSVMLVGEKKGVWRHCRGGV